MCNSTESFTDKLKRQQDEEAESLLIHTRQTLQPLKKDITKLYDDVQTSIEENTASISRLLRLNLILKWWMYPLTATVFLALILLPGMWLAGNVIAKHLEIKIGGQLTEIRKNEENLKTMQPWGIVPRVASDTGQRYLVLPKGSPRPELWVNDAGYRFVMLGVYEDETKED